MHLKRRSAASLDREDIKEVTDATCQTVRSYEFWMCPSRLIKLDLPVSITNNLISTFSVKAKAIWHGDPITFEL